MIHPTGSKVLVQLNNRQERSGLIWIPRQAQDTPFTAAVVAIGPWQQDVKPGDTVVISNYAGVEFSFAGEEYIMVDASELMARIEDGILFEHIADQHCFHVVSIVKYMECTCGATRRVVEDVDDVGTIQG